MTERPRGAARARVRGDAGALDNSMAAGAGGADLVAQTDEAAKTRRPFLVRPAGPLVVRRNETEPRRRFHRYSLLVWCVWLVPYIGGMILGMRG